MEMLAGSNWYPPPALFTFTTVAGRHDGVPACRATAPVGADPGLLPVVDVFATLHPTSRARPATTAVQPTATRVRASRGARPEMFTTAT